MGNFKDFDLDLRNVASGGEALGPQTYLQGALQLKLDQAEYGRAA